MLITLLIIAVYSIIFLLFAFGVANIVYSIKKMTKTEIKEQVKASGFFKISAVLVAFALTVSYCGILLLRRTLTSTAVITLNYAEASLGQNANKTRYNMDEIICDEVIAKMIEKGGFDGIKVSDFEDCFKVSPLVEGSSDDEGDYHISTEFLIKYEAPKKMREYPSDTVLNLLCESYRDYYFERCFADFELEDDFEEEAKELDYYDKVTYLSTKANQILNYLYGLQNKSSSFISEDGTTFESLAAKVFNLKDYQIENELYSFILQNGISNDVKSYSERLKYDNRQNSFDKDKKQTQYEVTNEAVLKYAEQMATAVLVPTRDSSGEYYMGRTKIGVDELSIQATEYSDDVASCNKDIENNNLKIKYLNESKGNTEENKIEADKLVNTAYQSIIKFANKARSVGREYYSNQMNHGITSTIYEDSIFSNWKSIVLVFVCGYFAVVVFAAGRKMKKYCKDGE